MDKAFQIVEETNALLDETDKFKKRLHNEITERQIERLQRHSIKTTKEIVCLALDAEHELVRLKACADILDRAGFQATKRIQIEQETTIRFFRFDSLL